MKYNNEKIKKWIKNIFKKSLIFLWNIIKIILKFIKNNFLRILELLTVLLAIVVLPMPWFNGHSIWNDFFMTDINLVDIEYLGDNTNQISFEITNNYPYMINGAGIEASLNCSTKAELIKISSESKKKTIPSGQSEIFYIDNSELLTAINAPKGSNLEFNENVDNYPVYITTKNKNIYILNHNGKITKGPLDTPKVIFYEISCGVITEFKYTYKNFGKSKKYTKEIKELTMATAIEKDRGYAWVEGPFSVMSGGHGGYLDDICKIYCPECAKYPDWDEALDQNTAGNEYLCRLWVCDEIKKQYPNDTISCLNELQSVCLWHRVKANETLQICENIENRLKNECLYYNDDQCCMFMEKCVK